MSIYNPGIPTGTVNLDQDYKNIQNNFSQLDTSFGSDHVKFSVNPASPGATGYHTNIHQIPQSDPAAIVGISQLYAKTVSGDTQLFHRSGGGGISQLTGYRQNARGWQYIGGVLLQWGIVTIPNTNKNQDIPVTFTASGGINFSTAVYSIQLTLVCKAGGTNSSNNSLHIVNTTVSTTGFQANLRGESSGDFVNFYWIAIGV